MEELLNKLIKAGWKPRENKTEIGKFIVRKRGRSIERPQSQCMIYFYDKNDYCFMAYSLRELVSKESGLRQFVCNNGLIPEDRKCHERVLDLTFGPNGPDVSAQMCSRNYEYWLMSSSLCNERDLEKFLIDNIKV